MTEERIRDIIVENDVHLTDVIIKAMKQAVNEALDEAAEKATTKMVVGRTKPFKAINRDSILNLKVK